MCFRHVIFTVLCFFCLSDVFFQHFQAHTSCCTTIVLLLCPKLRSFGPGGSTAGDAERLRAEGAPS